MSHKFVGETFIYRENRRKRRARRFIDIALVLLLALVVLPVVAAAALAILIEDGRPFFFTQRRVGRFERLFVIYKLRTMRKELCGDGQSPTSSADNRITRVGRILRKTSIDELPQLLNVLRGEMSPHWSASGNGNDSGPLRAMAASSSPYCTGNHMHLAEHGSLDDCT